MKSVKWTGFTLIELMIASVLVALAGLAAYHSYSQGILVWKKGQENSNQDKAMLTLERISRDLKNTFSFSPIEFSGEETKISFPYITLKYDWTQPEENSETEEMPTSIESSVPLPLITKITYEYNQNEEKLSRLSEIYAFPNIEELKADPDYTQKESSRVILEDVEILKFSYAITKTPEFSFSSNALNSGTPYAVKIELKLKSMKDALTHTIIIPIIKPPRNEDR